LSGRKKDIEISSVQSDLIKKNENSQNVFLNDYQKYHMETQVSQLNEEKLVLINEIETLKVQEQNTRSCLK
jgi:hypothetical protein